MPADFDYLRRGGRLSPLVSYVGKAIHLTPIMTQTEDSTQLTVAGVRRGFVQSVKYIINYFTKAGLDENWRVYISHAAVPQQAELARKMVEEAFPGAFVDVLPLSPAFITQGGPECVAIQVIHE